MGIQSSIRPDNSETFTLKEILEARKEDEEEEEEE